MYLKNNIIKGYKKTFFIKIPFQKKVIRGGHSCPLIINVKEFNNYYKKCKENNSIEFTHTDL